MRRRQVNVAVHATLVILLVGAAAAQAGTSGLLPTTGVVGGAAVPGSIPAPVAAAYPAPVAAAYPYQAAAEADGYPAAADGYPAAAGLPAAAAQAAPPATAATGLPATAAAGPPTAAAAAAPAVPQFAAVPGRCAVNFAVGQQCGGNLTGSVYSCSMFQASCTNTKWAGGCCPAAAACQTLSNAGDWCMTCGGNIPKSLAAASESAAADQPSMCTKMGANSDFDYKCALGASLKFYDAQRAGKLPAGFSVPWRGSAGLLDRAPNGASLAGGWYDAGDMTRFTFPAAFSVANLALAYLEFPNAFSADGSSSSLMSSLRWAADWLVAARYAPDAFVAVTWAPGKTIKQSHDWWGKPEEVRQAAEVRVLKAPKPGADLLSQGAAALAAVSAVFQDSDPAYSDTLLQVARGLFNQAIDSRGLYSDSVPEVKGFYQSYSYMDDLAWAAAWLAVRTRDASDINSAKFYLQQHISEEAGGDRRRYDYNNMLQGVSYLLAKLDPGKKDTWSKPIRETMTTWLRGQGNITFTPKGMAWIDSWGNLRYVAAQAFMGLLHNKLYPDQSKRATVYTCFARKQARIMMGETGRSYVVGVGNNPPCRPHHRAASCGPPSTVPCDCTALYNTGCNPNTLYGALIGGPDKNDKYEDVRTDFAASEVTLDWNAGFTGMLAGLSDSRVTWDDCKSAGLQEKPGDISPALTSAAARPPMVGALQLLMAVAVGVFFALVL